MKKNHEMRSFKCFCCICFKSSFPFGSLFSRTWTNSPSFPNFPWKCLGNGCLQVLKKSQERINFSPEVHNFKQFIAFSTIDNSDMHRSMEVAFRWNSSNVVQLTSKVKDLFKLRYHSNLKTFDFHQGAKETTTATITNRSLIFMFNNDKKCTCMTTNINFHFSSFQSPNL